METAAINHKHANIRVPTAQLFNSTVDCHTPDRRTSSGGFGTSFAPSLPVTPVPPSNRLKRYLRRKNVCTHYLFSVQSRCFTWTGKNHTINQWNEMRLYRDVNRLNRPYFGHKSHLFDTMNHEPNMTFSPSPSKCCSLKRAVIDATAWPFRRNEISRVKPTILKGKSYPRGEQKNMFQTKA